MNWAELREKLRPLKGGEDTWGDFGKKLDVGRDCYRKFMLEEEELLSNEALDNLVKHSVITQEDANELAKQIPAKIEYVPLASLKPHPLNAEIYSDGADQELLNSIKEKGIVTPLIVSEDGTIISGHRRYNAAQMLGLKEVLIIRLKTQDTLEIEELLILTNKQRQKTNEQIAKEYAKLKTIEAERAKRRMSEGGRISQGVPNSAPLESDDKGKARDKAAETLGIGRDKAEKAVKVVTKIEELKKEGKLEEAVELKKTLNEKSVNAAYKKIASKKEKPASAVPMQETLFEKPEPVYPSKTAQTSLEVEELQRQIANLKASNKTYASELQDAIRTRAEFIEEVKRLRGENEKLKNENKKLKEENKKILKEKERIQTRNDSNVFVMEDLQRQISSLKDQLPKKSEPTETTRPQEAKSEINTIFYSLISRNGNEVRGWRVNPKPEGKQYEFLEKETAKKFKLECVPVSINNSEEVMTIDQETVDNLAREKYDKEIKKESETIEKTSIEATSVVS